MLTIYVYSNETGRRVAGIDGADNAECERLAADKWGSNDYHWSYSHVPVSNADDLSDAARALGRKGGQAGTGAAKRRDPKTMRAIQARAVHVRRVTAARKMLDGATLPGERTLGLDVIRAKWGLDVLRDVLREK